MNRKKNREIPKVYGWQNKSIKQEILISKSK